MYFKNKWKERKKNIKSSWLKLVKNEGKLINSSKIGYCRWRTYRGKGQISDLKTIQRQKNVIEK